MKPPTLDPVTLLADKLAEDAASFAALAARCAREGKRESEAYNRGALRRGGACPRHPPREEPPPWEVTRTGPSTATVCKMTCLGGSENGTCECTRPADCVATARPDYENARAEARKRMIRIVLNELRDGKAVSRG